MTHEKQKNHRKEIFLSLVFISAIIFLIFLPTGFEKQIYLNSEGVRAVVLETDNTGLYDTGLIKQGDQICTIKIQTGRHKNEVVRAVNLFTGKMELDTVFQVGDTVWILLEYNNEGVITFANMVDHYRIPKELLLIGLFAILLICFSGFTGVRTLLSFSFALLMIWKVLIPFTLNGYSPIVTALFVGNAIAVATLLLVAGLTKKAYAAIIGTVVCSVFTCVLSVVFGNLFKVHGAVMQWSESLLYAGYRNLNLTQVFQASIYLACSGAVLDLAVDISAALEEIVMNQPRATFVELFMSGMRIGHSVVGSQTSTLLLAYMGSYISVMMVYMAQGTPMLSILNSKAIAGEIMNTFVGCIGLVVVCPLTSLISAFFYRKTNVFDLLKR